MLTIYCIGCDNDLDESFYDAEGKGPYCFDCYEGASQNWEKALEHIEKEARVYAAIYDDVYAGSRTLKDLVNKITRNPPVSATLNLIASLHKRYEEGERTVGLCNEMMEVK